MNLTRRQFTKRATLTLAVAAVGGPAFTAPACGVSKEKAVKVTGFVIDIVKEATPLLNLIGAKDLAITVEAKVIPALEKLKSALADADIPASSSMLDNVRSALRLVGDALLNLPPSARRTTIIGILGSVSMLLLTVEAFVKSETSVATGTAAPSGADSALDKAILKAFEASRQ